MLEVDVETYLPGDLLVKMDIATMAYSLEARSPLLDHELMEFARLAAGRAEGPRDAEEGRRCARALRGWVPDEILDAPEAGLRAADRELAARRPARLRARRPASTRSRLARGYFRRDVRGELLDRHVAGARGQLDKIWALLVLELWHREFVDAPVAVPAGLAV